MGMSAMDEDMRPTDDAGHVGITLEDLPGIMRELFDQCVADARAVVDPREDFDTFVDTVWEQVAAAFSLVRQDWPDGAPAPWPAQVDEQRGLAEALLEGRTRPGDLPR